MTDPIPLTDAEITAVAGGAIYQDIYISASQRNTSSVTESATAVNSGRVTATASSYDAVAIAVGAEARNTALVAQLNVIAAVNAVRLG